MSKAKKKDDLNHLRVFASEAVCRLYEAGDLAQLDLLKVQINRTVEILRPTPTERDLLEAMHAAYCGLVNSGWRSAQYAPADKTPLLLIEAGSTGVHRGWRDETCFWIFDGDTYPSSPILFKPVSQKEPTP
jgi:hypothetical protein